MTHNDPKGLYVSVHPGEHISHPSPAPAVLPHAHSMSRHALSIFSRTV